MNNVLIGRYIPTDSQIHKLDPRTKLISITLFIVAILNIESMTEYVFVSIILALILFISRISASMFLRSIKPFWMILALSFIVNIFTTKEGMILGQIGTFNVYYGGIIQGFSISYKFILLILITTLLTLSTTPVEITDAIERLFAPFKKLQFPVHEAALVLSIALRFIPTLSDEADKIIKAQSSRGLIIDQGNYFKRIYGMVSIIIALVINSFKRAEDLSNAMESRGYRGGLGRTRYRRLKWSNKDNLVIISFIILLVIFYLI